MKHVVALEINQSKEGNNKICFVGFEVFMAVAVKNAVFRDVVLCESFKNRRFGGTCRLHLRDRKNTRAIEVLDVCSFCKIKARPYGKVVVT
jgi:hypothetical protein